MFKKLKEKKFGKPVYNLNIFLDFSPMLIDITGKIDPFKANTHKEISDFIEKALKEGFDKCFTVTNKNYLLKGYDSQLQTKDANLLIHSHYNFLGLNKGKLRKHFPLEIYINKEYFYISREGRYLRLNPEPILNIN